MDNFSQQSSPQADGAEANDSAKDNLQGKGYMQIFTTSANRAIPLGNVLLRIYEYNPDSLASNGVLVKAVKTDGQGKTPPIELSAPARASSLYPNKSKGYSSYNIEAYLENYYPQQYINVPIFDGITAIQYINLIPISENGRENLTYESRFFETQNQYLE